MKKEKYSVIADTSVLDIQNYATFFYFEFKREFFNLLSFINQHDELSHIKILIPRIVIEELKNHQIDAYNRCLEKLKLEFNKVEKLPDFFQKIPSIDYEKFLIDKLNNFIGKYKISIIFFSNKRAKILV